MYRYKNIVDHDNWFVARIEKIIINFRSSAKHSATAAFLFY